MGDFAYSVTVTRAASALRLAGFTVSALLVSSSSRAQAEQIPVPEESPLTRNAITNPTQHTAGVVFTIAGATAMPVGGVFAVLKLVTDRAARSTCSDDDETCDEGEDRAALDDRTDVYNVLSASFMFGGLALMATGITLMTTATEDVPVEGEVSISPLPYRSGAGVGLVVRW